MSACCGDPACSHSLFAAATSEATKLTDKEREIILGVLGRDELIRRRQQHQVTHLKAELQNLRRKGALRPSTDWDSTGPDPDRSCGRCRVELGRVINRGAYCRACRLKVCKSCREYSYRTTEWVCTVCHKHMEIQAASGEWMNEFVRRPSRRRDTRVYQPAADIIKRTIRRSWTISNPTPRWNALRSSPERRAYSSLPRGQDINNYPALAIHQTITKNEEFKKSPNLPRSAARRTLSEDVYCEENPPLNNPSPKQSPKTQPRINPLIKYAEKPAKSKSPSRMPKNPPSEKTPNRTITKHVSFDNNSPTPISTKNNVLRTKSLNETKHKMPSDNKGSVKTFGEAKKLLNETRDTSLSKPSEGASNLNPSDNGRQVNVHHEAPPDSVKEVTAADIHFAKEEAAPVELCDIEPFSGTVFRKVTVRRRRNNSMRKISGCVEASGWRRGPDSDLLDILLPEGDDYKLVFISSDSSSKEDIDDNDSSSTASSFPIEDGDWDYFEPGTSKGPAVLNWASPFGSPSVYRKSAIESPIGSPIVYRRTRESDTGTDDDITRLDSGSPTSSDSFITSTKRFDDNMELKSDRMEDVAFPCKHQPSRDMQQKPPCHSCGAPTQYIPIPVPVPIPFPVPTLWTQEALKLYGAQPALEQSFNSRLRTLPRNLWPYMNNSGLIWPLISAGDHGALQSLLSSADGSIPLATDHDAVVMQPAISTDDQQQQFEHEIALEEKESSEKNAVCDLPADEVMFGYLECENTYASSSSDSDISGEDENDCDKPRTMRMYNVNEGNSRESDDALPSSNATSCDEEDGGRHSQSSVKEDDMSSTGSNETDTDDTGTVADKKTKKFSKIFVVNKNISSSSEHLTSSDTDSDTSDNNTDTELDCTVILTNMTPLHESNSADKTNENLNNTLENHDVNESLIKPVETEIKLPICANEEYTSSSPGLSDVSAESLNSNESEFSNNAEVNSKKHTFEQRDNIINKSEIKKETLDEKAPSLICSEWNVAGEEIRSSEPVSKVGERETTRDHGAQAGVLSAATLVTGETPDIGVSRHAAPYKTRVMITQDSAPQYDQVSVVTSDTTTVVPTENNDVVVQHTNWQNENKNNSSGHNPANENSSTLDQQSVKIITGEKTLSAFEEGLADDDSWVENLSHDDDFDEENSVTEDSSSGDEVTLTCSAVVDQEDVLRGYHRGAIDFTLHTIVEESCEESEVEQFTKNKKARPTSATDLEKYFFFGLGDGANATSSINTNREDAFSDTSSIYSESMDSMGGPEETQQSADNSDPAELASSRLEKYFLSGFMGFTGQRRDSDGSVGSDSEGRPSPEQRRKKLVRARGTGRFHSSSLDNLLANPDLSNNEQSADNQNNSASASSSDTDTFDETITFEKADGQFDTVKRKKNKKQKSGSYEEIKSLETTQEVNETKTSDEENDGQRTPQPESNLTTAKNQQSRDSGFVGSCDDLLKEQREVASSDLSNKNDTKPDLEDIIEEKKAEEKPKTLGPPVTSLTRKDSFNNWSSDEETNLMMCKMRQFFKTMVANTAQTQSTPSTPTLSARVSPKPVPSPRMKHRSKPPQLVYFENELTRLMKTVPGIREDQVREIVEYLSSEDTWSDSYDSSDYTSSDLECANTKSALQQQISDSCKQIINKFDKDEEGDEGDGGIVDESQGLNRETAFVYQKLVASFEKMATGDNTETKVPNSPKDSPPLIAKVMHHIGSRLVALMHEVSSGESHASNSPKVRHYHKRLQHKISSASTTTTEDDESTSDSNLHDTLSALDVNFSSYNMLSRSRSHDLLVGEAKMQHHQSSGGVSDIAEEREASDCERFSWRGSFESALLASDSRTKLSLLSGENSASASALAIAAKRRSAGDLLFNHKSFSREQLDRVRSCGSIGGANSEDKLWVSTNRPNRRRSSVPDATCGSGGSADGEDDDEDEEIESRATLPRSLQSAVATTNSLPRLPTNNPPSGVMSKAQSMHHFLQQNAKSARYRPPGFSKVNPTVPKRAVSAPGLQPTHQRRSRRSQQHIPSDDVSSISEAHSSPMLASRNSSNCPTPSPGRTRSRKGTSGSISSQEWHNNEDEHVSDRMVVMQTRSSLSSLGFRSDSMASVYSGAGEGRYGSVTVRGQVEFGLQYNYKAGDLEINIKQCKDLAPVDTKRNRSDPYVKVYLLPDKSKSGKRKTKVKKHTLNPVFDEIIKFHISLNGLETRTLWLTVWHSDMFGRNDFLGEVMMTLENKVFDDPAPKCYTLQERTEPFDDMISFKGDIIVCLKFVPPDMTVHKKGKRSRGTLHVLVKEAKCLTAYKANGTSDPFCKSYLLPEKGRNSKQKTPVAKKTINPSWNHTFVYDDVTLQELAERCLELTVWDHDRLASNEFLGGVRFSLGSGKHYGKPVEWMDASGKELTLWKSMLERPNFWVEGCLSLRPTLESRIS